MATYEDWLNDAGDVGQSQSTAPIAASNVKTYGDGTLDSWLNPAEDTWSNTLAKSARNTITATKGLGGVAERLYGELPAALGEIQQSAAPSSDDSFLQKYFVKPIKREFATEATLLNPASYTSLAERGKLSKEGQTTQEEANAQLRTNQPNVPEGGAKYYINQLGQMVPVVAGATAAGLAGGPEAAAAVFGAAGGLETYGEQREAGRTPGESLAPAAISATANTALGMLPIHAFLAEGPSMVGKVTKGAITGIAANDLITTIQQGVNKETIDPNMTFDQFVHSLKDPTVIGALVGGLGGAAGRLITGPNQEIINKTAINDVGKSSTTEATPAPFLIDPNNPDRLLSYSDWSMQKNGDVPAYLRKPSSEEISSIPPIPQSAAEDLNVPAYLRKENVPVESPTQTSAQPSFALEDTTVPTYLRKNVNIKTESKAPTIDPTTIYVKPTENNQRNTNTQPNIETPTISARSPLSQQSLTDDFTARKELVNHYLDIPKIQDAYAEDKVSDNDLHNMAIIEMTNGAKDRDKYLNGILKGKDVSDLVPSNSAKLLTTQERQYLSNNGETTINQPTATAGASAINERLKDIQDTLDPHEQAYNIAAEAKDRLAKLAEKTARPTDTINPERELSIVAPEWKSDTRRALAELFRTETALQELHALRPEDIQKREISSPKETSIAPKEILDALEAIKSGNSKEVDKNLLDHLHDRNLIYSDLAGNPLDLTPFGNRLSEELRTSKENPSPLVQEATTKIQQPNSEPEVPFSIAPATTLRDRAQLEKIKQDVISAAQRINPKVDVRFAEQLLGEGPALIRSGAETSARQEVAGSYDKLNNLIDISTNLKKFDPTDTAHHELFHSIEGLLTPEEQTALTTQYPGTDRLSPDEHKATAFADWARGKMANTPMGIRRIFSKVADVFKNLGNVFRRNKVQSADDVFQKVFSGDVGKRAIEAINNADSSTLRNAHPELLQQAAQNSKAPELADIMNTPLSPSDTQALQKIATENSGTPTEKVYSIGHDINTGEISDPEETREKIVHATKAALAQIASPEYVNKVYGEQEAALHALNEEAAEDIFKQKTAGQQAVQAINHVGRGILQSNDGNLRWLAKAKNSETVRKIANMFLANPGANEHNVETFHEERSRIMTDGYNTIYKAIEKIPENEHHRVTYFMQHPEEWEHNLYDPAVHAASKIARFVDLTRQEFTKLGIPVNETKGFFPRVYKTADILANPKAFRKDAFKAYSEALQDEIAKPGMSQQDINAAIHDRIDKWIDNIALQHMGLSSKANDFQVFTSAPTAPNSLRSRVFEKAADDILRKWLVQDPTEAMSGYVYQASRAIPWERRFGGNKWTDMKQAMINEGLDGTDINAVTKIIKSNTGQLGEPLGQAGKTVTSAVRTLASLAYLSRVTFKHLSYPIYMGIRTGNLGNVLRGFSSSTKAMLNTQWGTVSPKMEILKGKMELASLMGEASERAFLDANMGATPQDMLTSINKKWYDNIGITHLMQSMKLAAADTTQYTIAKLAKDVATNSSLKKSAQTLLRGMGVPDEHMENFAHWVTSEKDSIPAQAWESSQDPNAELYRLAMRRGLDQTIVNPNPATAQLWASHPIAGMAYSLSRFMMGLTKQLVVPVLKQGREALQPGYTLGDRARLAAPLMMMPLMTAFTYGYNAIMDDLEPTDKDVYHPAEKRTTAQQLSRALFESEMFAQGSKPMHELAYMLGNAINPKATAKTIDKPFSSSTLGPIAQLLEREGKMVGNIPDLYKKTGNIPKDNMAQRQELTATYNLVVKPALSGAISTLTPEVARPLAFMAIQAVNSPQARRGFVNEFARKKVR